VDAGRAGAPGDVEDRVDAQVALGGRRRPDPVRLVGHAHEQRVRVGVGVDRDRAHAEPPRRADDANGDLAAIGDEHG